MVDEMPEQFDVQSSPSFLEKLNADSLQAILSEAHATVRGYDTKAQIVGVGYIFALGVVRQSGDNIPVPVEYAMWYVLAGWLIIILPIIMFALVLYPSRMDKVTRHPAPNDVRGVMYFSPQKFRNTDDYSQAIQSANWQSEVIYEILKVSSLRDMKRIRFLRALYWAGGSFIMLFLTQMLRASGMLTS